MRSKSNAVIIGCGVVLVVIACAWSWRIHADASIDRLLPWLWAGSVVVIPLYLVRTHRPSARLWAFIWTASICMRAAVWTTSPVLSDDVYRYVWDGRVQCAGINPYRYAPADTRLTMPRNADYEQINHKEIPTIYPPLAESIFALLAAVSPRVGTFKLAFGLLDLLLGWLLWQRLQCGRTPSTNALLLYLWHPLIIYEFAGSGHVDVLWALLFVAALWALEKGRPIWAAVAFAGAVAAKLIALAFLPLIWSHDRRVTVWALILVMLSYLPYASAGWSLFAGLQAYALFWRFNDFGFALLAALPSGVLGARLLAPCLGLAAAIWIVRRRCDIWLSALAITVVMIALVPVNYPWYWALLIALLVIRPVGSLYLFSLAILLTYEVLPRFYADGIWHQALWVRGIQALLLAWGAVVLWHKIMRRTSTFQARSAPSA
jgi:hypothetical protein